MKNTDYILFDGVCNLCSGAVQFILPRDKKSKYCFASLQSIASQKLLKDIGYAGQSMDSIVLISEGKYYSESDAVLRIAGSLPGLWPVFTIFRIIPKGIRDAVYKWVARHRYKWFGKKTTCWLPSPQWKSRFLD